MADDILLQHIKDGVLTLTLNRPEKLNALNPPLLRALTEAVNAASRNAQARVVLITGAGCAFCVGGDISGKPARKTENSEAPPPKATRGPDSVAQRISWLRGNMETVRILHEMDKPTICVMRGATISVGLGLAGACDFRIASETASFATGFAQVGFSGDYGATWFLTRLLGSAKARELMLLGERIDAAEALRIGFLNRVVPDDQLETEAGALARRLAAGPPITYGLMKKNLRAAISASLPEVLDMEAIHMVLSSLTADQQEAVKAFLEKRPPRFTGA